MTAEPPLVTIITPTLNAAIYLPEMLASVAAQTYAPIEHIVVDGGSADATVEIAERSGARVINAQGLRQSAAINRGAQAAHGDIFIVLNADDILYPAGAERLAAALAAHPQADVAYGDADHIAADGTFLERYPTRAFSQSALLESCFIAHPASAVRRSAFVEAGGIDERFDVAMDYELWMRLAQRGDFVRADGVLAATRIHNDTKTLARRGEVYRESERALQARYGYVPYTWALAHADWLLSRRDPFAPPPRTRRRAVLLSLALGLRLNARKPLRYLRDWTAHRRGVRA